MKNALTHLALLFPILCLAAEIREDSLPDGSVISNPHAWSYTNSTNAVDDVVTRTAVLSASHYDRGTASRPFLLLVSREGAGHNGFCIRLPAPVKRGIVGALKETPHFGLVKGRIRFDTDEPMACYMLTLPNRYMIRFPRELEYVLMARIHFGGRMVVEVPMADGAPSVTTFQLPTCTLPLEFLPKSVNKTSKP